MTYSVTIEFPTWSHKNQFERYVRKHPILSQLRFVYFGRLAQVEFNDRHEAYRYGAAIEGLGVMVSYPGKNNLKKD